MSVNKFGIFLKTIFAIRVYKDGDAHGFVWRLWNPATWILAPCTIMLSILMQGIPETFRDMHELGFGMKPWFIKHPERLEWLP